MHYILLALFATLVLGCGNENNTQNTTNNTTIETNSTIILTKPTCTEYDNNITLGKRLYTNHCTVCHNDDAKSGDADIRGTSAHEISYAFNGVGEMSGLNQEINATQITYLEAYLKEIKNNPDIATQEVCNDDYSKALLGRSLFTDTNLSLNGTTACASCHDAAYAFSDGRYKKSSHIVEGAFSVGDDNHTLGLRNAPTIMYAKFSPTFTQKSQDNYIGGQFHDGRAKDLSAQAKGPVLDMREMMMPSVDSVIKRIKLNQNYVTQFKNLYGEDIFENNNSAFDAFADAVATFESDDFFAPFDSKYDRFKEDNYTMSELESQGYALFFSDNLSCKKCHTINSSSEKSTHELFTNYAYENIGTPRNLSALQLRDGNTSYIDYGLGGRSDIKNFLHYGKIKVPTLRNVAITAPYMHNGVFKNLRTVLEFYDHQTAQGSHAINKETNKPWESPDINSTINHALLQASDPLSDSDIDALIAFLKLLTDKRYEALLQ